MFSLPIPQHVSELFSTIYPLERCAYSLPDKFLQQSNECEFKGILADPIFKIKVVQKLSACRNMEGDGTVTFGCGVWRLSLSGTSHNDNKHRPTVDIAREPH